jgi:hypothetical protein
VARIAWSRIRSGLARSLALLLGMFVAATAFTVLTAADNTAQLRTIGTVSAHFQPAYDILVRPAGARSRVEDETGTVQPDFLFGIYGGITMAQWHKIAAIPDIAVAAPIAMVGYTMLPEFLNIPLPASAYTPPGRQLYRVSTTWISEAGRSRISQPASYVYVTPRPVRTARGTGAVSEQLPDGRSVTVCPEWPLPPDDAPFGIDAQSGTVCLSGASGAGAARATAQLYGAFGAYWLVPALIAAVDPDAEAKLDGLNRAMVSGHYLPEHARDKVTNGIAVFSDFPAIAASSSGVDEYAVTRVQRLPSPVTPPVMTRGWAEREARVPGRVVDTQRTTVQTAYRQVLIPQNNPGVSAYWGVSQVGYRSGARGSLTPVAVTNPPSVWSYGLDGAAMDDAATQYRRLSPHGITDHTFYGDQTGPLLIGTYDPARIQTFDPLSQVPLGAYQPLAVRPASAASRAALHGQYLLPNENLGGLVSQPVDLVTTLSALPTLWDTGVFGTGLPSADPISAIRVRVAGVTGPNPESLERIREVAQQIAVDTHLTVDIVAGSSPEPVTIDVPAGKFGQPALALSEDWVKKGVAVTIIRAVDRSSLVLFVLILVVCALFVANSAAAAIRNRRRELGVLACVGWTGSTLFLSTLGELATLGLAAGVLGAIAALPVAALLGLHAPVGRALLAVPAAIAVALVAGVPPAWLAARVLPIAAVRPPVLDVRRGGHPRGVGAMALHNVSRTPGRALIGIASLAVGIAALTILVALSFAFRGVVVGSLLGDAVAVQVRGVDYIAVAVTVALGVLAVADVVFLNIRERSAELSTLRAIGWGESALGRLVVTEGAVIGLAGSLAGAGLGLAGAAEFTGQLPASVCLLAAAAGTAGIVVTASAAFLPARALQRLPAARLLAEE